jgi:hypothetical protein
MMTERLEAATKTTTKVVVVFDREQGLLRRRNLTRAYFAEEI